MDELKIKELVESILQEEDLFLVNLILKGHGATQKVLVLADGDDGISIDQCGKVSRRLGNEIEERDLIQEKYTLEVSSPGLDFPITLDRQYRKNVGRELTLELIDGGSVDGELLSVNEEAIRVMTKKEPREYPLKEIKQSKIKISFK